MLFIPAGSVIHLMKNTQNIRLLGNLNDVVPYIIIRLLISNIALRGVPFVTGFYRKNLIPHRGNEKRGINIYIYFN